MASIIIPSRRIQTLQPKYPTGVNWGNPLSKNLLLAVAAPSIYNSTGIGRASPYGTGLTKNAVATVNTRDEAVFSVTNESGISVTHPSFAFGTGDFTFVARVGTTSSNTDGLLFSSRPTSDVQWICISGGVWQCRSWGPTTVLSSSVSPNPSTVCTIALQRKGGTGQFYQNGIAIGSTGDLSNSVSLTTLDLMFWRSTGARWYGDVRFMGVYNRALEKEELLELTRNPWQVFAPANSPVFYSLPSGAVAASYLAARASRAQQHLLIR